MSEGDISKFFMNTWREWANRINTIAIIFATKLQLYKVEFNIFMSLNDHVPHEQGAYVPGAKRFKILMAERTVKSRILGPIKKKLVYHPFHPKKVRREGGFYFFNFFNFLYTRFCCTLWVFKLHYYADIVVVVVCDKTCDTGPWRCLAHHN
jgi:hypothetical protein